MDEMISNLFLVAVAGNKCYQLLATWKKMKEQVEGYQSSGRLWDIKDDILAYTHTYIYISLFYTYKKEMYACSWWIWKLLNQFSPNLVHIELIPGHVLREKTNKFNTYFYQKILGAENFLTQSDVWIVFTSTLLQIFILYSFFPHPWGFNFFP